MSDKPKAGQIPKSASVDNQLLKRILPKLTNHVKVDFDFSENVRFFLKDPFAKKIKAPDSQ